MINLVYARRDYGGGSTSFTVHLYRALQMAGADVRILRITDKPKRGKSLAKYSDTPWIGVTASDILQLQRQGEKMLLAAPEHSSKIPDGGGLLPELIRGGMRLVIHDPNEFMGSRGKGVYDHLDDKSIIQNPICIRPSMKRHFKDATFIPHPYVTKFNAMADKHSVGCSLARITFVKRTEMLLAANELLPDKLKIVLFGAENRLYTKFKVMPRFPNFRQGGYGTVMNWDSAPQACAPFRFMFDMTKFPHDGGGSQYTFMEAWDSGSIPVIHSDWLDYPGEMVAGENCIAIDDVADIVELCKTGDYYKIIAMQGYAHVRKYHDPKRVGKLYIKEMQK